MTGKLKFTEIPLMANYLTGNGKYHLEVGLGLMPFEATVDKVTDFFGNETNGHKRSILGTATLGYRLQLGNSGFMFRIALTPLFTLKDMGTSAGLSFGYTF
ncbi:MAG: hypothetical protein ACMUIP_14175 [bacterium]